MKQFLGRCRVSQLLASIALAQLVAWLTDYSYVCHPAPDAARSVSWSALGAIKGIDVHLDGLAAAAAARTVGENS
jgi:hypothetical protein